MKTAVMEAQTNARLRYAMQRLLHSLRPFMRAYERTPEVEMPEHDLVWAAGIGDGPDTAILEALKAFPVLWAAALPKECCIVSREMLSKCVGPDVAEMLAHYGAATVDNQAARLRHEAEQRDLQKRYK